MEPVDEDTDGARAGHLLLVPPRRHRYARTPAATAAVACATPTFALCARAPTPYSRAPRRTAPPFAAGFFLPFVLGDGGRTLEESSSTYALRMKYIYPKRKADDA